MEIWFFVKCFFIGVLAASGCGPLFILTFNRAAICGFLKGLATAIGAALGDGFFFMLGLAGALAVLGESRHFMIVLDLIGGLVLVALAVHSFKKMRQFTCVSVECSGSWWVALGKAFTLTIVNPLIILFFMAVSIQILPEGVSKLPVKFIPLSMALVILGSLVVLGGVALIASFLGSCISARRLRIISGVSGVLFLCFGGYLFYDFVIDLIKLPIFGR